MLIDAVDHVQCLHADNNTNSYSPDLQSSVTVSKCNNWVLVESSVGVFRWWVERSDGRRGLGSRIALA
jgi:hypothetical protein